MKRMWTLLLAMTFFYGYAQQPCTPDPNLTEPGIYPPGGTMADSLVIMPDAPIWSFYDETAQMVVPSDTTIDTMGFTIPATIDSIKIISLKGLPSGLGYECDNPRCKWNGGDNGCVRIFGTTTSQPTGNYFVTVKSYGYVDLGAFGLAADTVPFYMRIKVIGPIGIEENTSSLGSITLFPQPAYGSVQVSLSPRDAGKLTYDVIDLRGAVLIHNEMYVRSGDQEVTIDIRDLASGPYLIRFIKDGSVLTRRLLVDRP